MFCAAVVLGDVKLVATFRHVHEGVRRPEELRCSSWGKRSGAIRGWGRTQFSRSFRPGFGVGATFIAGEHHDARRTR